VLSATSIEVEGEGGEEMKSRAKSSDGVDEVVQLGYVVVVSMQSQEGGKGDTGVVADVAAS